MKASVNLVDHEGFTPIYYAIYNGKGNENLLFLLLLFLLRCSDQTDRSHHLHLHSIYSGGDEEPSEEKRVDGRPERKHPSPYGTASSSSPSSPSSS